jgi:hypothetical protein
MIPALTNVQTYALGSDGWEAHFKKCSGSNPYLDCTEPLDVYIHDLPHDL